jgi:uncharacterized protein (UPF0332 family)
LKRAVSTAYYAIFHAMCQNAADMIVGGTNADRSMPAWRQAYRAVDHGFAKNQCKNNKITKFPKDVEDFASLFVESQDARHGADYDPFSTFTRSETIILIARAEQAIRTFSAVPKKDKRAFAVFVAMKER